jgi:PhoH-like ATPase
VIRRLDALREKGRLGEGVPMDNGGILKIEMAQRADTNIALDISIPDNRILCIAYRFHKEGQKVIFVSKDINARLKADALGIEAQDFEKQKVNFDELFQGYRELPMPKAQIDAFFQNKAKPMPLAGANLLPNEFVIMVDEANPKHTALGRAAGPDAVEHLESKSERVWTIRPRSKEQRMAVELLLDPEVQIVTLVGQAGTGKTLLALAAAMDSTVRQSRYDKILVTRPVIPLGKDIGYLPGAKEEKLSHWMQPIFDNMAFLMRASNENGDDPEVVKHEIEKLQKEHLVEMEALTYIRGRSIPRQYIIVDEAQNLTPHEVKTIVSRAGEGTKMVLTGDPYQIDSPYLDASSNGLTYAVERLKSLKEHGHITLKKSERSRLAGLAAELL